MQHVKTDMVHGENDSQNKKIWAKNKRPRREEVGHYLGNERVQKNFHEPTLSLVQCTI